MDPGTTESAYIVYDTDDSRVIEHQIRDNHFALESLRMYAKVPTAHGLIVLVLEAVESYGMAVGKEVFETVFWSGRFAQAWFPRQFHRMPRRTVNQHLCHTSRATDSNIRQAIIDRFGPSKDTAIGSKKQQGPLYGIKSHEYAALAVALTWADQNTDAPTGDIIRPGIVADF